MIKLFVHSDRVQTLHKHFTQCANEGSIVLACIYKMQNVTRIFFFVTVLKIS